MAHPNEQQGNRKSVAWQGPISRLTWGERWRLLGLLGVFVLLGLGMASAQAAPFAYITNKLSNNVAVIDTATNTVLATVPVGNTPLGVAVHPAGTFAYVANNGSNTVSVIDTATHTVVKTIGVGHGPDGIAVHPAGNLAYVTNNDNTVSVIDTTIPTVIGVVLVGSSPYGVTVHPDGTRVYVANSGGKSVSIIDTSTNIVVKTVTVGQCPNAFGQFIGGTPPPPPPPTLTLTLTGCTTCKAGDTFSVTATVKNPATKSVSVEIKAVVVLPDGTEVNVWAVVDKHFTMTLSDGFDVTVEILKVQQVPNGLPKGTWAYEAALIDPELGRTLARDAKPFTMQ